MYIQGLNLIDLEDLLEDIKVYCEIERDTNTDFWIVSHSFERIDIIMYWCREKVDELLDF